MPKYKMERLPRGFGGVVLMSGKRAKPYMVRVKVGMIINEYKGTAYPKYKIIGYANYTCVSEIKNFDHNLLFL